MDDPKTDFEKNGFLVVKKLLSSDEANDLRNKIDNIVNDETKKHMTFYAFAIPDGIRKYKNFWYLIWHPNIIKLLHNVVSKNIKFAIHNDIHRNLTPQYKYDGDYFKLSGWHRDTRFRSNFLKIRDKEAFNETQEKFKCIRLGIYLNNFDDFKSYLYLIPKSHLTSHSLSNKFEIFFWYRVFAFFISIITKNKFARFFPFIRKKPNNMFSGYSKPYRVELNEGDVVLFDTRVIHAVSPSQGTKHSIFIDYGIENEHTYDHINYYLKERKDLGYSDLQNKQLDDQLEEHDLLININNLKNFNKSPMTGRHSINPEEHIKGFYLKNI